jgi:signal peptidase I
MRRVGLRKIVAASAVLAAVLVAWVFLAPRALGGSTTYLAVTGSSMEPRLESGDLVLLRTAKTYEPNDVVAYESDVANRVFVHRIVRWDGSRFILKGDANTFLDSGRPGLGKIDGKLWFALPMVGSWLAWLAEPVHAAFFGGSLAVLLLFAGSGTAVYRRRRGRRNTRPLASTPPPPPSPGPVQNSTAAIPHRSWVDSALVVSGAAFLAAAALGLLAFSRPTETKTTRSFPYRESGSFGYSGEATAGVAYPDGRVDTSEPVFLRLVDDMRVSFDYRVQAESELDANGQIGLVAVLAGAEGWKRVIELQRPTAFTGSASSAEGVLDLRRLSALIKRVERETGVAHESYDLTVIAQVDLRGRVGGAEVSDSYAPRLGLRLDRTTLQLDPADGAAAPTRLRPTRARSAEVEAVRPAAASFFSSKVSVVALRRIALGAGAPLLLLCFVLAFLKIRALRGGEPARIAARYGHLIVPVSSSAPEALGAAVEVATVEGLGRLAEAGNRPILHAHRLGVHAYYVEDGGIVYRYSSGRPPEVMSEDAEAAARLRLLRRHA